MHILQFWNEINSQNKSFQNDNVLNHSTLKVNGIQKRKRVEIDFIMSFIKDAPPPRTVRT